MINRIRPIRFCSLVLLLLFLGACNKEERRDYCKNHYLFHADHADTLARLEVTINNEGLLQSSLAIPSTIFGPDPGLAEDRMHELALLLQQNQSVYSLQTERDCEVETPEIRQDADGLLVKYESRCGSDNRLRQVDIHLLDLVPELEEVEARITTDATSKQFAISRQCESAIFRLERSSDN